MDGQPKRQLASLEGHQGRADVLGQLPHLLRCGCRGVQNRQSAYGVIERGEMAVTIVRALKMAQALEMTLAGLFTGLEQDRQEADL